MSDGAASVLTSVQATSTAPLTIPPSVPLPSTVTAPLLSSWRPGTPYHRVVPLHVYISNNNSPMSFHLVQLHLTLSHFTLLYLRLPHLITSHLTLSRLILSHPISSFFSLYHPISSDFTSFHYLISSVLTSLRLTLFNIMLSPCDHSDISFVTLILTLEIFALTVLCVQDCSKSLWGEKSVTCLA